MARFPLGFHWILQAAKSGLPSCVYGPLSVDSQLLICHPQLNSLMRLFIGVILISTLARCIGAHPIQPNTILPQTRNFVSLANPRSPQHSRKRSRKPELQYYRSFLSALKGQEHKRLPIDEETGFRLALGKLMSMMLIMFLMIIRFLIH